MYFLNNKLIFSIIFFLQIYLIFNFLFFVRNIAINLTPERATFVPLFMSKIIPSIVLPIS